MKNEQIKIENLLQYPLVRDQELINRGIHDKVSKYFNTTTLQCKNLGKLSDLF
jgi:hypothetical protein